MTAPEGKKLVLIGYMRVSKTDGSQVVDLQSDALVAAGVAVDQLYTDRASGKRDDRPGLEACLRALRDGDTLMVWKLDRLGRSLKHLVDVVQALNRRGVGLKVLTGQGAAIDTTTANGRLMFNFFAALAEFERNLIRERTHAGLAAARARGRKGGRKPALTPQQVREIKALLRDPSIPVASIADRYGVSRATIYKHAGADAPAKHQSGPSSGPAKGANRV